MVLTRVALPHDPDGPRLASGPPNCPAECPLGGVGAMEGGNEVGLSLCLKTNCRRDTTSYNKIGTQGTFL